MAFRLKCMQKMIWQKKRQPNPIFKRLDCLVIYNEDPLGKYEKLPHLMKDPSYRYDFFCLKKTKHAQFLEAEPLENQWVLGSFRE